MAQFIPIDFDNDAHFNNVMSPPPSAPVEPLLKNTLVPLPGPKVDPLAMQVNVKLDVVIDGLAKVHTIMIGVGEVESPVLAEVDSVGPMPIVLLVSVMDATNMLIVHQHNETRAVVDEKTTFIVMCIFAMFVINWMLNLAMFTLTYFHPSMCALIPPVPPVCAPGVNVTDWSEFAKNVRNEFVKNARDEWAH
jgi:hypothetical protein